LKQEIGFTGIVITDAMRMRALDGKPGTDWQSVLAGADMVLMSRNARLLQKKIVEGYAGGLKNQLAASVEKVYVREE
jgi:beta-glucosidase-like glycosyl hydrolase